MAIRRCPYCKAIIDESQKYCNNCGTQLLFPEDDQDEEPIKGEKIVDDDFKDVVDGDEDEADDRLLTKDEAELQEIDLEAVLEGKGRFPGEPKPKAPRAASSAPKSGAVPKPPTPPRMPTPKPRPAAPEDVVEPPARPVRKSAPRSAPRAVKKPAPDKAAIEREAQERAKQDTKDEIARLIAVLEEKERRRADQPGEAEVPPVPPEPTVIPMDDKPTGLGSAWEELLQKPVTVGFDGGEIAIPRVPDTSPEESFGGDRRFADTFRTDESGSAEEEDAIQAPPPSLVPGDTMDFQDEVLRQTPIDLPDRPSTRTAGPVRPVESEPIGMGIPERITREEIFQDRDENETPPESTFSDLRFTAAPAIPATSDLEEDEEPPRRRLGFFRKLLALAFDVAFIGAVWAGTLWLAARLMGADPLEMVETSPLPAGILLAALLGGYFFLFQFFLGETLGDRMASRKS